MYIPNPEDEFFKTKTLDITTHTVVTRDGEPALVEMPARLIVRSFTPTQWRVVIDRLANLFQYLPVEGFDADNATAMDLSVWTRLLSGNASDDLFAVLGLAIGKDEAFFDTIYLDDAIRITTAVVDINKAYFVKCLLPLIKHSQTQA